jgi:decaprenylphospho-beta-D-ribofuranose 2-oxidase
MNPWTIKAFNEAYFRKHPAGKLSQIVGYEPFFFPLDFVRDWNRIYGARGFLQYQLVVPHDPQHTAIRKVLTTITQSGMGSFLAVIKEFGEQTHPYLSFPRPGVTLALDFPNYGQALFDLLDQLDLIVLEAGGRVYLGKDARLPKAHFQAMYPEWETWKNLKEKYDPSGVFSSLLAQRLGLL